MDADLETAVRYLAGVCDGAFQRDGSGYNKIDAALGHKLAATPESQWTPRQRRAAWRMIAKYRGQLSGAGIDYAAIPEPPKPENGGGPRRLALDGSRIAVSFPYDPALVSAARNLPSRKFDGATKRWLVPTTPDGFEAALKFAVDHNFDIDEAVIEKAAAMMVGREENLNLSRAEEAEIDISGLGGELRPFQKAGVSYALKNKRAFLADEMGLGKTIEALGTLQALSAYPALVICPASLKYNWYNEVRKWLPGKTIQLLGTETTGRANADLTIINYDQLKRYRDYLVQREFKAVIADESHYCKSSKAARTQYVEEIANGCLYGRSGRGRLDRRAKEQVRPPIEVRLLLSGTPLLNRPEELVSQLQILDRLREFGGWYGFMRTYCDLAYTRFGMDTKGGKNLTELNHRLRATCLIRRLKADVLKELPPKQRTVVPVEITNRTEYLRAERDLIAWLQETAGRERADAALRAEQLVRIEALKQLAARGKLAVIKEWVEDFLDTDQKIVLFGWHKEVVLELSRAFSCDSLHGGTPVEQRQAAVERFQSDPSAKVLVANMQTGGLGLTLTAASNVVFCELGWNPAQHDQAGDRCVVEGQPILTIQGWKPVEDVAIGDLVISHDGLPHLVTDTWSRLARSSHAHNSKDITEIEVECWNETIKITSDHLILTNQGWIAAGDIKPRHKLLMPNAISGNGRNEVAAPAQINRHFLAGGHPIFGDHYKQQRLKPISKQVNAGLISLPNPIALTENAMFVFGYYIGDGFSSISPNKGRFVSFAGHKDQKFTHLKKCAQWMEELSIKVTLNEDKNSFGAELRGYSSELALWFTHTFGRTFETKMLPEWIYETSSESRQSFIRGWLASDGYVRHPTSGGMLRHEIITGSRRLAADATRLLLSVGLKPCINRNDIGKFWSVGWTKDQVMELCVTKVTHRTCNKTERIYDLTVEDAETFVVGTIVVHNCHRIGQKDNVMEWWFVGRGTIEEDIQRLIERKRVVVDAATEGEAGAKEPSVMNELVKKLMR